MESRALVVTSHVNNSRALCHALESIRSQPMQTVKSVIVVVGGYDDGPYKVYESGDVVRIHAPHNSIDFTGLIALVDLEKDPRVRHDSYFYIHDTTRIGPHFMDRVYNIPPKTSTASFMWPSMNMGLYAHKTLVKFKDTLENFRNEVNTTHSAQVFKNKCVVFEDCIFRANIEEHVWLSTAPPEIQGGATDYYGNGVRRIVEYYPTMDLYKIKANWEVKDAYELQL